MLFYESMFIDSAIQAERKHQNYIRFMEESVFVRLLKITIKCNNIKIKIKF